MLNTIVRGLVAVLVGVFVIVYRDAFLPLVVQVAGALFLVSGVVSFYTVYMQYKQGLGNVYLSSAYAVVAVCGILLGAWLILNPLFFVGVLVLLFGALLLFLGVYQLAVLVAMRKHLPVRFYMCVVPVLLLVAGFLVVFNPFTVASVPFIIVGVSAVLAGVHDLFTAFLMYRNRRNIKALEKQQGNSEE